MAKVLTEENRDLFESYINSEDNILDSRATAIQNKLGGWKGCRACKHLHKDEIGCKAFPDVIPHVIFVSEFDHRVPFKGDNGILFEPKD